MLCPICQTEFDPKTAPAASLPFCCARCKQIDLGRWLGGNYTISTPGLPREFDPDEEPEE